MRKHFLSPWVAFLTFVVGVFAFSLFWSESTSQNDIVDSVPAVKTCECTDSKIFPGKSREISGLIKGKSGYFPNADFSGPSGNRDAFINDWYGKHLTAMREKSLLDEKDPQDEIYRFLWLRSFHHPIYVRIERRETRIRLSTKELGGAGGYEPGKIIRNQEMDLNQKEWCQFVSLLESANFWGLPTNQNDDMGLDGAEWILEGVKANRYHAVDRWSPEKGEYREACVYLLKISGIDVDKLKNDLY